MSGTATSAVGLPISNVVNISVVISPNQIPLSNFGSLLIIGSSGVIPISQRLRRYTSITQVYGDFGVATPEAIAAGLFFEQSPQPQTLYIGQWNQNASPATLTSGFISPTNQVALLASLVTINNAGFSLTINGNNYNVLLGSLSNIVSYNQLAVLITSKLNALVPGMTCVWSANNNVFTITSPTTGVVSQLSYATPPSAGTGTDVSGALMLSQYTSVGGATLTGAVVTQGAGSETPLAAVAAMMAGSLGWYECMFASTALLTTDHLAIGNLIEAASPPRLYGITDMSGAELVPGNQSSIGYLTAAAALERVTVQYSSSSPYAVASFFGRGDTVDFTANNTTITLNGKTEPGVLPETLNLTQYGALSANNVNVFVNYQTGTAIIQNGTMANGYYFDEVQGSDWLANDVQTRLFNRIINSPTKIPQTDAGVTLLKNDAESACADAVNNGLVGPGTWQGPNIGSLQTGDALPNGYYVYAPPIASQAPATRQARIAPTLQICVCFAGAIQRANGIINVQR